MSTWFLPKWKECVALLMFRVALTTLDRNPAKVMGWKKVPDIFTQDVLIFPMWLG
jgi:hypothetical protein